VPRFFRRLECGDRIETGNLQLFAVKLCFAARRGEVPLGKREKGLSVPAPGEVESGVAFLLQPLSSIPCNFGEPLARA